MQGRAPAWISIWDNNKKRGRKKKSCVTSTGWWNVRLSMSCVRGKSLSFLEVFHNKGKNTGKKDIRIFEDTGTWPVFCVLRLNKDRKHLRNMHWDYVIYLRSVSSEEYIFWSKDFFLLAWNRGQALLPQWLIETFSFTNRALWWINDPVPWFKQSLTWT